RIWLLLRAGGHVGQKGVPRSGDDPHVLALVQPRLAVRRRPDRTVLQKAVAHGALLPARRARTRAEQEGAARGLTVPAGAIAPPRADSARRRAARRRRRSQATTPRRPRRCCARAPRARGGAARRRRS